jgi:F-type H+-transporting ATPase subunit delta
MARDQDTNVARVYALSALELAESEGVAEEIGEEAEALLALLDGNAEIEAVFASPLVDTQERQDLLDKVFRGRLSDLFVDTLQVMNRKGRAGQLRAFAGCYAEELEKARNIIEVSVTTAIELTDEQRERLSGAVEKITGMRARLDEKQNPDLLGGLVLQVGDRKIDSSVATELEQMKARFLERGSQELLGERTHVSDAD